MAKLVVIAKGTPGKAHELNGHWTTVGRADGNMFQIVEPSISGRHCEVRVQGDELAVRDLLSTNGTFVRGEKISEATLKPGHTLRLGEVELRFENSNATATTPGTSFISKMLLMNTKAKPSQKTEAVSPKPAPVVETKTISKPEAVDEPAKKYHALFVDDSMAFLETFSELCSEYANRTWKIHSAPTADRALAILQESQIDLVVLDIGIPLIDGIQLLGIVAKRYPGIKIAVMTGNATEKNRATCLANGAELFIEKPVSPDGVKVVFNMLNDLMSWAHGEGFSGALREVGLQDVIQMECIGRRSMIFEIRNLQLRGQIYIENGTIIHATVGTLTGEQAFFRLLSLKGGEFQMLPFKAPAQRTIQGGWELLLMEAARLSDEDTAFIAKPSTAKPAQPQPPSPKPSDTDDDLVVVATYDGQWNPVSGAKK